MNIMHMDEGKVLKMASKTQQLMEKGVKIHNPDTLDIGEIREIRGT
ncbi:MAG: hypothetical protein ACOYOS_22940 [Syntrophales bacterium]